MQDIYLVILSIISLIIAIISLGISIKIYKEYEFIYIKEGIKYHGIIDLMLEYDDHIDIVDYKLKNIEDEKYILQLKGYQEFIKSNTSKPVLLYLYSIINGAILKIE